MRIIWLVGRYPRSVTLAEGERGLLNCAIASVRLRMGVAATAMTGLGHRNVFVDPEAESIPTALHPDSTLCVVSKFAADNDPCRWLQAVAAVRDAGCPVVIDVCDHPLYKPRKVAEFYEQVLQKADRMVTNSSVMAEFIQPYTDHIPAVIEDPVLAAPGAVKFLPGTPLKLLWFGHPTNAGSLIPLLEPLSRLPRACRLTIVSINHESLKPLAAEVRRLRRLVVEFLPWSIEQTANALHACDLVLLPNAHQDPRKAGASSNRLAEALNAGRFPVASPIGSYLPYSDCAWVQENLVEGVQWAAEHRNEVVARLALGQRLVTERLSCEVISGQWVRCLTT